MPQAIIPAYNPPIEGSRSAATYADTEVDAGADDITLIVDDAVSLRRQTEIFNGLKLLVNYVRDNRLLEDGGFSGSAMTLAVNIDAATYPKVRTGADLLAVSFAAGDLALAMGATATGKQHVMPLDTAFDTLMDVLLENFKDQAAA
jgi:hypothetical protein